MKQAAFQWVQLALVLALLIRPSLTAAQHENEASALQRARTQVAQALGVPGAAITFEGLKLVQDKLGEIVCGKANGKRFLAGPSGKPPPQIEGALSASMFDYLWNARCQGMSASAAEETFRRELK